MTDSAPRVLHIEAKNLDDLFERSIAPSFPHTRRLVNLRLADYLQNLARERPRARALELEIALHGPPVAAAEEEAARHDLTTFFLEERSVVGLELRVNQREGWGFLLRASPLLVVALAIAGLLYLFGSGFSNGSFGDLITALFYLLFITVVWVLLWDPIEKLLFDAYLIRARLTALNRLAGAPTRFTHSPVPGGG